MERASRDLNVQFNGVNIVTTVTDDSFELEYVLSELRASLPTSPVGRIIGFDIKYTSNANQSLERAATLQLCHGNRCLVIQLLHLDTIPKSLRNFFADTSMKFFGVNIEQETVKLDRDYGLKCNICTELGSMTDEICESSKYSNLALSEIAAEILGVVIAKPPSVARSGGGVRVLNEIL